MLINDYYWFRVANTRRDYPPKKGGFLSPAPSHVPISVWAWAEPNKNNLPPTTRPKSYSFRGFPLYLENRLKHWKSLKMAHIRLEIIYNYINKPFQVHFHRINSLFFVFHLFNENAKYKGKTCFSKLKIYVFSFIISLGPTIAVACISPAPLCCFDAILRCNMSQSHIA